MTPVTVGKIEQLTGILTLTPEGAAMYGLPEKVEMVSRASFAALEAENARLREFECAVCNQIHDNTEDFFGEEFSEGWCEEVLLPLGYVERIPYDPDKHGELDVDPGEMFWHYTDKFMSAAIRKELSHE